MATDGVLGPFTFFAASFLATLLVAAGCAYLGVFIALKRIVFVGLAVAEFSAAGIAFAFFLGGAGAALPVSLAFSLGGLAILAAPWAERLRISRENVVGLGYAAAAAAAILLVWKSAAELDELKDILAGSSLFVNARQLRVLLGTFVALAAVHAALHKEFIFCAIDPIGARTLGTPARALDVALYVTIGAAIAPALRSHGLMSVFGYLVIPPIAGLLLARRLGPAFYHAVAQALIGSALGLWAASRADLPPGPATVCVLTALAILAGACSRYELARKLYIGAEALALAGTLVLAIVAGVAYARESATPPISVERKSEPGFPQNAPPISAGRKSADPIDVLAAPEATPFDRSEALDALKAQAGGETFGYDPDLEATAPGNAAAVERWRAWMKGR